MYPRKHNRLLYVIYYTRALCCQVIDPLEAPPVDWCRPICQVLLQLTEFRDILRHQSPQKMKAACSHVTMISTNYSYYSPCVKPPSETTKLFVMAIYEKGVNQIN
jgi:hypothetical protein